MCGIVGVVAMGKNQFFNKQQRIFKNLLLLDSFRGEDGTGVFGVRKSGNVDMLKSADPSGRFIYTPEYEEFDKKMYNSYNAVIGHNRKATVGKINDEGAHPFISNDIILVHNGKFSQHKKYFDTEVDSEALAKYLDMNKDNLDTMLPPLLEDSQNAFSLIWYNTTKQSLYLWRNDQRPMNFLLWENFLYFSSEATILDFAIMRTGLTNGYKFSDISQTATNTLTEINFSGATAKLTNKTLKECPKRTFIQTAITHLWGDPDEVETYLDGSEATSATESKAKIETAKTTTTREVTKTETKKTATADPVTLASLVGKTIIFKIVDYLNDSKDNGKNSIVEGIFRLADLDVTVSVDTVPVAFFEKLETWPHNTTLGRGLIKKMRRPNGRKPNEYVFDIDPTTIELFEGFFDADNNLITYAQLDDIGDYNIYCSHENCFASIPSVDYEDSVFKLSYTGETLIDHFIQCPVCEQNGRNIPPLKTSIGATH